MPTLVAPAHANDGDLLRLENGTITADTAFPSVAVEKLVADPDLGSWERRGYLAFDVSALPAGATVTGAVLRLYVTNYVAPAPFEPATIQVVQTGWTPPLGSSHWNASPRNAGQTFSVGLANINAYVEVPVSSVPIASGLATLRLEMVSTPAVGTGCRVMFGSANNSNAAFRPQLTITYTAGITPAMEVEGVLTVVGGWGTPIQMDAPMQCEGWLTVIAGFGQQVPVQAAGQVEGQLTLIVMSDFIYPEAIIRVEGSLVVVAATPQPPVQVTAPLGAEGVLVVDVGGGSTVGAAAHLVCEGLLAVQYDVGGASDTVYVPAALGAEGLLVVSVYSVGGSDGVSVSLRVEGQVVAGVLVGGGDVVLTVTGEFGVGASIQAAVVPYSVKEARPLPMAFVFTMEAGGVRRDRWVRCALDFRVSLVGEARVARREHVMAAIEVWLEVESGDPW